MKLGLTALRAAVGAAFFAHGAQKLFGWFGGHGLEATGKGFDAMGMRPGHHKAMIAGGSEAGGGALIALGLLTPVGSAATIGVMGEAIRRVHKEKGFFITDGGFEYNVVLIAAATALADLGPGDWSLDRALGLKLRGPVWAVAALAAGLAGPQLVDRLLPAAEAPAQPTSPQAAPAPVQATAA